MPTIRECFETDHMHCMTVSKEVQALNPHGAGETFDVRVHYDFIANSKFASVFVQKPQQLRTIIPGIVGNLETVLTPTGRVILPLRSKVNDAAIMLQDNGGIVDSRYSEPGSSITVAGSALIFTGRILAYTAFDIPESAQTEIALEYKTRHNVEFAFRGQSFAKSMSATPSAFVSHDSRDKDNVARPIATRLRQLGHDVWYDEFSLIPGDSLRESIETGLKSCRKCIVVLTPNFLSKGGWAKREYDSAYTRELIENQRVIVPVWSGVSVEDVYAYSPILADRVGLDWSIGEEEACKKLNLALSEDG